MPAEEDDDVLDSSMFTDLNANTDGIDPFNDLSNFAVPLVDNEWDPLSFQQPSFRNQTSLDDALYSVPQGWDTPLCNEENASLPHVPLFQNSALTIPQQQKLVGIAMPQHQQRYHSLDSPDSNGSRQSIASPEGTTSSQKSQGRKRKTSEDADRDNDDDEHSSGQHPPPKKTAHNVIEKRYRSNLNDKIAALRDSVPSLRIMSRSTKSEYSHEDREDLEGLTPAHKLNKATILSKATEYINHLEKRNKSLANENQSMRDRIGAFEKLFLASSLGVSSTNQYLQPLPYQQAQNATPAASPIEEIQGMIPVPEDVRRLQLQNQSQHANLEPQQYQQARQPIGPNGWQGGGFYGKLMIGSLAGIMIMEGFSEKEQEGGDTSARGLFAIPTQFLGALQKTLQSTAEFNIAGYHISATHVMHYLKLLCLVGTVLCIFVPSMFRAQGRKKEGQEGKVSLAAAPSLASSIEVRRAAWLTAVQTVWVPRHNFFLEASALCLKMVKLSVRNLIGSDGYAYITGITEQQEAARVKAWEIALDAQLAGGDVEVSKSRLTLTLMASGTLPDTPLRLMLKALHIRVLLWEVGNAGFDGFFLFREVATKLARWKWNEAKLLQQVLVNRNDPKKDELPEHLATLLELECDDVLVDSIGQRAYNLAWNLPTTHNVDTQSCGDGMDGVVEDFAILSPLDAVAAWFSSLLLQGIFAQSLGSGEDYMDLARDLDLAIKTAPIGSGAQARALVARAVLVRDLRGASISAAVKVIDSSQGDSTKLISTVTSRAALPDVVTSIYCAQAIAHLEKYPAPANPQSTHRHINRIVPTRLSTLGFTACFKLMERIEEHDLVAVSCSPALERLAGRLRIWIGGPDGERSGLPLDVKRKMIAKCLDVTRGIVGMKEDPGYESMPEEDPHEGC